MRASEAAAFRAPNRSSIAHSALAKRAATDASIAANAANICAWYSAGVPQSEIGRRLGVDYREIRPVLRAAGLIKERQNTGITKRRGSTVDRAATTQRACMCCRAMFASQGNHNRLCQPCNAGSSTVDTMPVRGVAVRSGR